MQSPAPYPQQQQPEQPVIIGGSPIPVPKYSKGELVLYSKDNQLYEAQVMAVDRSLWPPQYAIVLDGADNEKWTEEDRLRPSGRQQAQQQQPLGTPGHQ